MVIFSFFSTYMPNKEFFDTFSVQNSGTSLSSQVQIEHLFEEHKRYWAQKEHSRSMLTLYILKKVVSFKM